LNISRDFSAQQQVHPTQKPVPLLEWLIKTYSNENEVVLDNCMGSGSCGVAAVNLNRKFIGIEMEQEYFDISKNRLDTLSGIEKFM
jgi:site-specific DNA-methyltransferase (adenine-specific)